jgi:hypothetical protein
MVPTALLLNHYLEYRGYSKLRTRTVLGSYGRTMPRNTLGAIFVLIHE